jgi:hypothetical protein
MKKYRNWFEVVWNLSPAGFARYMYKDEELNRKKYTLWLNGMPVEEIVDLEDMAIENAFFKLAKAEKEDPE